MERVFAIADHLKTEGRYSDGVSGAEKIYHPGHNVKRLSDEFANAPIMVGNDEQYAAIMALLASNAGVPARVVMGAVVPEDGGDRGARRAGLGRAAGRRRVLAGAADRGVHEPRAPRRAAAAGEQEMSGTVVPPPAPIPPPSTPPSRTTPSSRRARSTASDDEAGWQLPGWAGDPDLRRRAAAGRRDPVVALIVAQGATPSPAAPGRRVSARIVGGWHELVDHARDLGQPVPVGHGWTRREQSVVVASAEAPGLARQADSHVFGPTGPADTDAAAYWTAVDAERKAMSSTVSRRRRLRAAINLTTFKRV